MNIKPIVPDRIDDKELSIQINLVSKNFVMSGLLHAINGILAVLNDRRQVIALNDSFLQLLGIEDPAEKFQGYKDNEP